MRLSAKKKKKDHISKDVTDDGITILLSVATEQSLVSSLRSQCSIVERVGLQFLYSHIGIKSHFQALRRYLLINAGDFMDTLCTTIFAGLRRNPPTDWSSVSLLNVVLEDSLKEGKYDNDHFSKYLRFTKEEKSESKISSLYCIETLPKRFILQYDVKWPLTLVITSSSLSKYQEIFQFFFRLKRISSDLKYLWKLLHLNKRVVKIKKYIAKRKKVEEKIAEASPADKKGLHRQIMMMQIARMQMGHVIDVLQGYMMTQVLSVSWSEFENNMEKAENIFQLARIHDEYIETASKRCFFNQQPLHRLFNGIFSSILSFQKNIVSNDLSNIIPPNKFEHIMRHYETFKKLVKILYNGASKGIEQGNQDVSDLVIRLDFNRFYHRKNKKKEDGKDDVKKTISKTTNTTVKKMRTGGKKNFKRSVLKKSSPKRSSPKRSSPKRTVLKKKIKTNGKSSP